MNQNLNRRNFLRISSLLTGGLAIGIESWAQTQSHPFLQSFQPNKFLVFQKDGFVRLYSGKSELGQGTNTSIKLLAAEELCISPQKILLEIKSPDKDFRVITGGSWGMAGYYRSARPIFASVRQLFIQAAAKKWGVDPKTCIAEEGEVVLRSSSQRIAYHELLDIATTLEIPEEAPLIQPSQYKYLGKSHELDHVDEILIGEAKYGIDQYIEGMLYASIERAPAVGAKVQNLDDREALKIKGVRRVEQIKGSGWQAYDYFPSGVAVLATNSWLAQKGREALKITWDYGGNKKLNNKYIEQVFKEKLENEGTIFKQVGDFSKAEAEADRIITATYDTPFWSHSPMEPMNTLAHVRDDGIEIWSPCHDQSRLLAAVKKITGVKEEQINIHTTLMGGSFGRRLLIDYAIEAVLLSQATDAPVQVLFSRIDETKHGHFMPGGKYRLRTTIKDEKPSGVNIRLTHTSIYSQREPQYIQNGIDNAIGDDYLRYPYEIPTIKYEHHLADEIQVPVSWWRGTFGNTAGFVMDSWLDEIAHELKKDPLDFRLSLLQETKETFIVRKEETMDKALFKRVLKVAGEQSTWYKKRKKRRGKGIAACFTFFESYAAMVAEVELSRKRKLSIKKLTCVVDCGFVVNPDRVRAQIESGIIFALSAMKAASINFEKGQVIENSYADYPILSYAECPSIEIHLLDSERPVSGVGELSNIPTFAAVCNAIYDACGLRIRSLPLDKHLMI